MASQLIKLYNLLDDYSKHPASPRSAVMVKISRAFLAALKSLSRSTLALRRLFKSWLVRVVRDTKPPASCSAPTLLGHQSYEEFVREVDDALGAILDPAVLTRFSEGLRSQFQDAMIADPNCMLPSYNHQLPHGHESGTYLALDVGGSTFRVALVELRAPQEDDSGMRILSLKSYRIDNAVKQLQGLAFFDWMALKIKETLQGQKVDADSVLETGVSWSFPIEQTSLRSGRILDMGKGFIAAHGLVGQDLGDIIQLACARRVSKAPFSAPVDLYVTDAAQKLNVELKAIVNDSTATLLTKAYIDSSTRFGLILGTGVNVAVHLPVSSFGTVKFGTRPSSWHEAAKHVLVNTECSMFGDGILPMTRWDFELNQQHIRPGFQPIEYLVSGRYLGEICRLILVDGTSSANLFGGVIPPSLEEAYSLDTELIANLQSSSTLEKACALFATHHPKSPAATEADIRALIQIAGSVTRRASAIVAGCVHALWRLRLDSDDQALQHAKSVVACNGSIIQSYPGFSAACQSHLDALVQQSGCQPGTLELAMVVESSLLGAAVAVACIDSE